MFTNSYKNKKVLVTGHTGFKGSWLTTWLIKLGANVIGVSKDIPTNPSVFKELNLKEKVTHYHVDIRNLSKITEIISSEKPDFLFHLAAQPIVSTSYIEPIETITSNVIGTTNVLDALKQINHKCSAILITSDKAYDNVEQIWGYIEDDQMGGKDIYSGSKGAAELIIKSYFHSFFNKPDCNVKIAVGRAGNVIGGGDWSKDRIVADCMRAWSKNEPVEIRNPNSTRPWQHVLEPLSGYLNLGQRLNKDNDLNGECFNFGPKSEQNYTVENILLELSKYWEFNNPYDSFIVKNNSIFHEAGLLKLNCDKALFRLNWQASLSYKENIRYTSEWYYDFYNNQNMYDKTINQISEYESIASTQDLKWTE